MKIFLSGLTGRDEFRSVAVDVAEVATRCGATVETRASISNVENDPTYPKFLRDVDFFLLCRSFPNEFCTRDVEALRRASPLAPIALVVGTLCEGEDRTGEFFPGVRRFYYDAWRNVGRFEFARFFEPNGAKGIFAASPTSNNVDLFVKKSVRADSTSTCSARVLILSDDSAMRALLADAFKEKGVETQVERFDRVFRNEFATPERVVVDSPDLASAEFLQTLERLQARFSEAQFDVLAFAPRFDEFKVLEATGKIHVVAKPFNIELLTRR